MIRPWQPAAYPCRLCGARAETACKGAFQVQTSDGSYHLARISDAEAATMAPPAAANLLSRHASRTPTPAAPPFEVSQSVIAAIDAQLKQQGEEIHSDELRRMALRAERKELADSFHRLHAILDDAGGRTDPCPVCGGIDAHVQTDGKTCQIVEGLELCERWRDYLDPFPGSGTNDHWCECDAADETEKRADPSLHAPWCFKWRAI